MHVVGVDVWAGRWVAVIVGTSVENVAVFEQLSEVATAHPDVAVVGVDIPIGLPETGVRAADVAARAYVRPRSSSVFSAPPRDVLDQPSYQAALAHSRRRHGRGLSSQAYHLGAKILEAEAVDDARFHEVHPEVSFRALKGAPLEYAKKTWNGQMERRELLADAGIQLPDDLGPAAAVAPDDVLDAAVAAWSARRIAEGTAATLPDPLEVIGQRRVGIWY